MLNIQVGIVQATHVQGKLLAGIRVTSLSHVQAPNLIIQKKKILDNEEGM